MAFPPLLLAAVSSEAPSMTLLAPNERAQVDNDRLLTLLTPPDERHSRRRDERASFPYRLRVAAAATGRRNGLVLLGGADRPGIEIAGLVGAANDDSEAVWPENDCPENDCVVGRDLSNAGLGFRHAKPLPFRRVLLIAADDRLAALGLEDLKLDVLLRWCRFTSEGGYHSGGQIVRSSLTSECEPSGDHAFF